MSSGNIALAVAFFAVTLLFRPILVGSIKAGFLFFAPRKSLEQRIAEQEFKDSSEVNHMAKDCEKLSPNLAQELRFLASRG